MEAVSAAWDETFHIALDVTRINQLKDTNFRASFAFNTSECSWNADRKSAPSAPQSSEAFDQKHQERHGTIHQQGKPPPQAWKGGAFWPRQKNLSAPNVHWKPTGCDDRAEKLPPSDAQHVSAVDGIDPDHDHFSACGNGNSEKDLPSETLTP
ncbi:MAG: hypothetical protein CL407_09950 [Acidimicrobiaceae bacterium]|nr:hypothetical protein [Acidimicrobiaceae bacterium]